MKSSPTNTPAKKAIAAVGLGRLARELGISKQAVCGWQWRGVPAERVVAVEKITGINRKVLRPDIFA